MPGWKRRAAAGLAGGPRLVITSKAVMDFEDGEMRLQSVHPGVTVEEVAAATGFELRIPATVPTTTPPTDGERAAFRQLGIKNGADETVA